MTAPPTFHPAPVLAPRWHPAWLVRRYASKALQRRDTAISEALDALDGLSPADQFDLCRARLVVMLEGGVLPGRMFKVLSDEIGRAEWKVARR